MNEINIQYNNQCKLVLIAIIVINGDAPNS